MQILPLLPVILPPPSTGLALNRPIRSRISAKSALDTTTSAIWNTMYRESLITLAPILISFSRSVLSDHVLTDLGKDLRGRTPFSCLSFGRPVAGPFAQRVCLRLVQTSRGTIACPVRVFSRRRRLSVSHVSCPRCTPGRILRPGLIVTITGGGWGRGKGKRPYLESLLDSARSRLLSHLGLREAGDWRR